MRVFALRPSSGGNWAFFTGPNAETDAGEARNHGWEVVELAPVAPAAGLLTVADPEDQLTLLDAFTAGFMLEIDFKNASRYPLAMSESEARQRLVPAFDEWVNRSSP